MLVSKQAGMQAGMQAGRQTGRQAIFKVGIKLPTIKCVKSIL